ncbi:Rap1a/Tai family immunity protein [Oecophyllibacter saccharovorans]|uniref:Rap1a/Tai family immunity protein n=1 Tax=Oecophyllibacter saccharovorans TaxID=2558360 RepID=UPI001F5012D7|nr:Rap1a/Tai family immunity protein [Oecophyllibacter saccharovorans]
MKSGFLKVGAKHWTARSALGLVLAAGAALCMNVTGTAQAQRVSRVNGKGLGAMCSQAKSVGLCDAYLSGVMDSEVWARDYAVFRHDPRAPVAFCVPPKQTAAQVRNVVVAWLGAHPTTLGEPAGKDVYLALHDMYPCPSRPVAQPAGALTPAPAQSEPEKNVMENGK